MSERKEWLEQRMQGIGGSDVSAILMQNPWRTPLDVYLEKTGRAETWAVEPERVKWGKILEPVIAKEYAAQLELPPDELYEPGLLKHPQIPCILGTPDRMFTTERRGLEIKAVNQFQKSEYGEEGTDQVPDHYLLQVAHYLFLTDFALWDLAVLFGGQHLGVFGIYRTSKLDAVIAEAAPKFWRDYVVADRCPPVDETDRYGKFLASVFRNSTSKKVLDATDEFLDWLRQIREAKRAIGYACQIQQLARNHIMNIIAEAKGMKAPDGAKAQWIRPKPVTEVDWEGLAKHLQPSPELLKSYTKTKERNAYLRVTFPDDSEETESGCGAGEAATSTVNTPVS
jgi:putative phage-type endonuclease